MVIRRGDRCCPFSQVVPVLAGSVSGQFYRHNKTCRGDGDVVKQYATRVCKDYDRYSVSGKISFEHIEQNLYLLETLLPGTRYPRTHS